MRNARGYTLIEIMIAAAFFLLVMGVVTSSSSLVRQALVTQQSRIDARQNVRNMLLRISGRLRQGSHLYLGYQGNLGGHTYSVPSLGGTGSELIFAVPENAGAGSTTYSVYGLYAAPRQPVDSRNPSALQVVFYEKAGVTPPTPDTPASINLAALTGGSSRRFDCYIPPGNLKITPAASGQAVTLDVWFQRIPPVGPVQLEHYVTSAKLRNAI